jgi:multidrug efflux system membrane fusion protein
MKHTIIATLSSVAMVILNGCSTGEKSEKVTPPEQAVSAQVETVGMTPIQVTYEAVGTVHSKTTSNISSKVTGHIVAFHVEEGDQVTTGQLLVQLDDRDAAALLSKAEARLNEARNALQEMERATRAAEAAKAAAEANLALATATYERYKDLLERRSISQQEYDVAEAKYKTAGAETDRADEMLQSLEAKKRQVLAKIEQAKADVTNAQIYLGYTHIVSPITGLVTAKKADVGDLAQPGTSLLTLEDSQHYRLEAMVEESLANRIQLGGEVPVSIDALDHWNISTRVSELVPTADPASRSFIVKLDLPSGSPVRSGIFGRARFPIGQKQGMTVPLSAIIERGQLTGIFVLDQANTARLRLVKTGKQYGSRIEILSGLNQGERVVVGNTEHIKDGYRVND